MHSYLVFQIFMDKFVILTIRIITMKRILGLDLGTNSIGWAVVNIEGYMKNPTKTRGIKITTAYSLVVKSLSL